MRSKPGIAVLAIGVALLGSWPITGKADPPEPRLREIGRAHV